MGTWLARAAVGAIAIVGIWLGAAAWAVLGVRSDLEAAQRSAKEAQAALLGGEEERAEVLLATTATRFSAVRATLDGLLPGSIGWLPVVGRNVSAVRHLATAGELVATGARGVAVVLHEDGGGAGLERFLPQDGTIPLAPMRTVAPALAGARDALVAAEAELAELPPGPLLGPVDSARDRLVREVERTRPALEAAAALVDVLPAFLGNEQPRRYLFCASTPAELRGTGGFLGAYAILTADAGRLSFSEFGSVSDLPTLPPSEVEAPNPDYAARYDRHGGAGFWQNINLTPDFPSAAVAMERLWTGTTGEVLDGVVVVDPHAFAVLLDIAGPTSVPGVGRLDADSVVRFVAHDAYAVITDPDERKHVLGRAAAAALQRFLAGPAPGVDAREAIERLARTAGAGHVLVHSRRAAEQTAFELAGVGGALPAADGNTLAAVVNNASANKIDFYAERRLRYRVELEDDGGSRGRLRVELGNRAPAEGVVPYVIGPTVEELAAGDNRGQLSVFCGADCAVTGFERSVGPAGLEIGEELGHVVASTPFHLHAGDEEVLELAWKRSKGWRPSAGRYELRFRGQPTIRPTQLVLEVVLPPGTVVTGTSEGMVADGRTVRWEGDAPHDEVFEIELLGPGSRNPGWWARLRRWLSQPVLRLPAPEAR